MEPCDDLLRLPHEVEIALFRIVQEALTNAAKHARARAVTVAFSVGPRSIQVEVRDDGVGFDPKAAGSADHQCLGLLGMAERAEAVRGSLKVDSAPGRGTIVGVEVPR